MLWRSQAPPPGHRPPSQVTINRRWRTHKAPQQPDPNQATRTNSRGAPTPRPDALLHGSLMPTEHPLQTYRRGALPHRLEGVLNLEEVAIGREDRDRPVVARHDGGGGHTTDGRAGSAVVVTSNSGQLGKSALLPVVGAPLRQGRAEGGGCPLDATKKEAAEHQASIGVGGTAVTLVCN